MGSIAAGDLTLLRQPIDLQKSVERLYCLGFDPVWTGRVNDATITRGERSIVYDGGAMSGTFVWADLASFDEGLEVWFGSTAGGQERGRRRLRSMGAAAAAGTLVVDWSDDIDYQDDDYITIVHNYPAWPKYSWFTATGPVFKKDGPDGTLYAASGDANETPAPHVIMGRHYAGEMPAVGNLTISFDASNTVDVAAGGGGSAYAWDITPPTNASFDNDAIAAPTMTVTANGRWWVHCTVTIDGRSTTAHRAVIVGNSVTEFERGPITTKWDSTSLECQISSTSPDVSSSEIRDQVTWADFEDHALVILTSTDYYGTTQKSIDFHDDAVYDDRHHIVFTGYLLLENDDFLSTGAGQVQMSAVSLMDMFIYSLSLTGGTSASQWYEMLDDFMTVAGNLLHLFRWHSTLLDIADWWFPWSDTVKRSANEEFGEGDIMERARALCRARVMGMTANPQGEVFIETDLNTRSAANRAAATTTLTLTDADIAGDKRVRIRRRGDLIRVLLDGGYSQGRMGTFQPYFSASQEVARAEGRPALVHLDRLMLPNQTEANRLAGRLAGVANRKFSEVNLDFAGNYREVFSPVPQQWTNLGNTFASTLKSNLRGFDDLESALAVPREVTYRHDNRTGVTNVSAVFDVEAPVELTGVTITPPVVPSEDPDDGGWDFPGAPEWPALPEITYTGALVAFDDAEGCWMRLPEASDWEERNGSRGTDDDDNQGGWDPWWFTPAKANSSDPNQSILWACQDGKIWRSTDGGTSWLDVTPGDDPPNDWGDGTAPTVADLTFIQRTDNIHQNKAHYFSAEWQEAGGDWRGWLLVTEDDGVSWEWVSLYTLSTGLNLLKNGTFDVNLSFWTNLLLTVWANNAARQDHLGLNVARMEQAFIANRTGQHTFSSQFTRDAAFDQGAHTMIRTDVWPAGATLASTTWVDPESGTKSSTVNLVSGTTYYFHMRSGAGGVAINGYWDNATIYYEDAPDEIRPIWMDVDSESGDYIYLSLWIDGRLEVWTLGTDSYAVQDYSDLGTCTIAQLNAKTYWAAPHTPAFNADYIYVFGRMNAPQGLASPEHLIVTTDGGGTWASLENGFGADYIGAFRAEGSTDAARTFYAVRNIAASPAKLYVGLETLTYRIDTSFTAGVYVDALTVNPDGQVAVGSDATNDIEIIESPWASWTDITDSYPGSATNSLTYI